ncbi:MAG: flagellar hook-length control protein FliK [Helicobacter sp.]|nr:flagellar hook-length control protein FliK [Helicobacter sp.]
MEAIANVSANAPISTTNANATAPANKNKDDKGDFKALFESELKDKIKELKENETKKDKDISATKGALDPINSLNTLNALKPKNEESKAKIDTKDTNKKLSDIKQLADKNDLNITKMKLSEQKNEIDTKELKAQSPSQLSLQNKTQETKINHALADVLNTIAKDDAKARKSKSHKIDPNSREAIISAKVATKEREEKFQQAIKDFGTENKIESAPKTRDLEKAIIKEIKNPDDEKETKSEIKESSKNTLDLPKLAQKDFTSDLKSDKAQNATVNFANQIKDAIKNYRPPLTKLEIELNPKELGKVKLDITKNGNDLQVNISGNNTALNLFWQNQNVLFQNLQDIGFAQVDLNFSNQNGQNGNKDQENANENENDGNKNGLELANNDQDELTIKLYA